MGFVFYNKYMPFQKGHKSGMTGKHHSEETKRKMSKSNPKFWLDKKMSEEHKRKMSNARKGKKMSEETKKKLSEINKGKIPWCKGKHWKLSDEVKKNISIGHKGIEPWNKGKYHTEKSKRKMSNAHKGIKLSEEHKKKISLALKGEKNYLWKGGISIENDKLRHTFEMGLWKRAVLERDNFTCQKYNIRGGRLIVHHIRNFAEVVELRTSIENGIILSEKAHKEFHKKYGKKNNTREQLNEFLTIKNLSTC